VDSNHNQSAQSQIFSQNRKIAPLRPNRNVVEPQSTLSLLFHTPNPNHWRRRNRTFLSWQSQNFTQPICGVEPQHQVIGWRRNRTFLSQHDLSHQAYFSQQRPDQGTFRAHNPLRHNHTRPVSLLERPLNGPSATVQKDKEKNQCFRTNRKNTLHRCSALFAG